MRSPGFSAKDFLMRYYPAAIALSLVAVVTASAGFSAPPQPLDPRAAALVAQGRTALGTGNIDQAIDAFESALSVQPGDPTIFLDLAEATRRQGLQGKALHYYREVLERDPQNLAAISGEGAAMVEKGAVEKAKRNLVRLQGLCGDRCDATQSLAAALAKGPAPVIVTAEAVKPDPVVTN
ncbi:MAG: tetratricopeptide repeat protein [Novosphingobium sp.]